MKNLFRRNRGGWNRFFGQCFCFALHSANQLITHNDERLGQQEKTADGKFLEEKCNALLKAIPVVKTDNDDDLLYHVVKGRAMVVVVKCAGSRFVLLVDSKLSLKYDFHNLGWLNVRMNSSISAKGMLREDVECDSPSMAAALVAGGSRNGLTFWKNKDWKTLKSLK